MTHVPTSPPLDEAIDLDEARRLVVALAEVLDAVDEPLTIQQASRRIGVSSDVLRTWCREDRLVMVADGKTYQATKLGGEYRIPRVIIDAINRGDFRPVSRVGRRTSGTDHIANAA